MTISKTAEDVTLAAVVNAHAEANFEAGGWDVVFMCFETSELEEVIEEEGATTYLEAIEAFSVMVSVWAERQADAASYREDA